MYTARHAAESKSRSAPGTFTMRSYMKKHSSKLLTFLLFSVLYTAIAALVLYFFRSQGKSLVYHSDGWRQHLRAMEYYSCWLHDLLKGIFTSAPIPGTYAFGIGYGSDILTTLAYYGVGDPLLLPAAFISESHIIYLYGALLALRPYLAGLSFLFYCDTRFKYKRLQNADLSPVPVPVLTAAALAYSFSGMVLYLGAVHPFFVIPLVIFPLILAGAERFLYEHRCGLLIFAVFLAGVSNYYFFYTEILLAAAYFIYRLFLFTREQKESIRFYGLFLLKGIGCVLLGVCMAGVILVPVAIQFGANSRLGIQYAIGLFYSADYYKELFANLLAFYNNPTNHTELGFAVPLVLALLLLAAAKGHRHLKITWLLTILLLVFPFCGHIFNGLSYANNRWSYAIAALACWSFVSLFDEFLHLPRLRSFVVVLLVLALAGLEYAFGYTKTSETPLNRNVLFSLCLLGAMAAFLFAKSFFASFFAKTPGRQKAITMLSSCIVLLLCVLSVTANLYYGYSEAQGAFPSEFSDAMDADSYMAAAKDSEAAEVAEAIDYDQSAGTTDNSLMRYSGTGKTLALTFNASMPYGLTSTQFCFSLANGTISSYLNAMGILEDQSFAYFGLDDRMIPLALANVRYNSVDGYSDQSSYIPYGFTEMTVIAGDSYPPLIKIFRNELPLSLGMTYDGYTTAADFDAMDCVQRQEAVTQSVAVSEEDAAELAASGFSSQDISYSASDLAYSITSMSGVTLTDASGNPITNLSGITDLGECTIQTEGGNASMTLEFSGLSSCETYLYLDGFYGNNGEEQVLPVQFDSYNGDTAVTSKSLTYYTEYFPFRSDFHDYIVNFGSASSLTKMVVTFASEGTYKLDDLRVVCQPLESAVTNLTDRLKEQMTVTDQHKTGSSYATNLVTGQISLDENKLVMLSIPYSSGWSATVDGKETPLYQGNIMYMVLPVTAGDHSITLTYHTPGLTAGMTASAIGTLLWILLILYGRRSHRHKLP